VVFLPLFAQRFYGGTVGALAAMEFAVEPGGRRTLALSALRLPGTLALRIQATTLAVAGAYLAFLIRPEFHAYIGNLGILGLSLSLANVTLLNFFQLRGRQLPQASDLTAVMSWVNLISVARSRCRWPWSESC